MVLLLPFIPKFTSFISGSCGRDAPISLAVSQFLLGFFLFNGPWHLSFGRVLVFIVGGETSYSRDSRALAFSIEITPDSNWFVILVGG